RLDFGKYLAYAPGRFTLHRSAKTNTGFFSTIADNLIQTVERTTHDKQNIGGIDLHKVLIRVFTATLRRYGCNRAFDQLEQCLLHALSGNVTGNGRVIGLT